MAETGMIDGVVVEFDEARGLGEVEAADGRRLPFHCVQIADGTRRVPVGVPVWFTIRAGLGGRWEAGSVTRRPRPG
jgi:cold shock CspA family protein